MCGKRIEAKSKNTCVRKTEKNHFYDTGAEYPCCCCCSYAAKAQSKVAIPLLWPDRISRAERIFFHHFQVCSRRGWIFFPAGIDTGNYVYFYIYHNHSILVYISSQTQYILTLDNILAISLSYLP